MYWVQWNLESINLMEEDSPVRAGCGGSIRVRWSIKGCLGGWDQVNGLAHLVKEGN